MGTERHQIGIPTVEAERVLGRSDVRVVDLRTPAEFAEDHLPGAQNVPLFEDEERGLIGALYQRVSREAAFAEGRRIARERLGGLLGRIGSLAGWSAPAERLDGLFDRLTTGGIGALEAALPSQAAGEPPRDALVLYCWRGGLRSRSVVALLRLLGLERAVGLAQGYKGYRSQVARELAQWQAPPSFVLRGLTGTGKTLVLRELERLRPGWTVDLEELAGHRSSILGMVGLRPCSQKAFESRIAERLRRGFPGPVVLEGESRKVGDAIVPESLWRALDGGANVRLEAPLARRIDVLIEDYLAHPGSRADLRRQLPFIERRLGPTKWAGVLLGLLDGGRERELVALLLERYYDPLYRHSEQGRRCELSVNAADPRRAAVAVAEWIDAAVASHVAADQR